MKIISIDKDIQAVLSSNYYKIPRFQRPYSWDRENISEFWNDAISGSEKEYFIGSMVVYKGSDGTVIFYGLVDGQQRLTTITMLLCALRNILSAEGFRDLADGIHGLIAKKNIENKIQFTLTTESSYPYFQTKILSFPSQNVDLEVGEEEKYLENAFNLITTYLEETVNSIKSDPSIKESDKSKLIKEKLINIRNKILALKLIFIELDNEDDAYIIFETLNTRGKDLSVSDLAKNFITKTIRPENVGVDTPKIKWEQILTTIEGSSADLDVDAFLHHYWLSKYDYVTQKKLFKIIRRDVKKEDAKSFLDDLVQDSVTYREIHETGFRKWKNEERPIKEALDALAVFRVKQQVPVVLSIMRDYKAGLLKIKNVRDILSAIEKFHFIFTAVTSQRSSGGISLMYASSAKSMSNASNSIDKVKFLKELKNKLKVKIPSYQEFEINFKEIIFTNKQTKNKNLVRYILSHLLMYFNSSLAIDCNKMTIEHIAPQTPDVGIALDEKIIGQMGNLLFITEEINKKLKNKKFMEKKKILQKNRSYLDDYIKSKKTWTQKEIEERTLGLANLAYKKIWLI